LYQATAWFISLKNVLSVALGLDVSGGSSGWRVWAAQEESAQTQTTVQHSAAKKRATVALTRNGESTGPTRFVYSFMTFLSSL
jgi:hypothetical protein